MSYLMAVVLHVLADAASFTSPGGAESHELLGVVASGDGARQAEDGGVPVVAYGARLLLVLDLAFRHDRPDRAEVVEERTPLLTLWDPLRTPLGPP